MSINLQHMLCEINGATCRSRRIEMYHGIHPLLRDWFDPLILQHVSNLISLEGCAQQLRVVHPLQFRKKYLTVRKKQKKPLLFLSLSSAHLLETSFSYFFLLNLIKDLQNDCCTNSILRSSNDGYCHDD